MDGRGGFGKILSFLTELESYKTELTADFRSIFGFSVHSVGREVSWSEGFDLVSALLTDPTSRYFASRAGMKHPVTQTDIILMNFVDLFISANTAEGKRPKFYPRPWKGEGKKIKGASMSLEKGREFFKNLWGSAVQ